MNRFLKNLWGVAIASILGACGDEPVTPPDPCANPPVISGLEVTHSPCGTPQGSIVVQAKGGSGVLQFSLNGVDFQESTQFTGLSDGSYTLTVKDEQSCTVSREVSIEELGGMQVSLASSTPSGCGTSEGVLNLKANGGSGDYSFSLDGKTFQPEPSFHNLSAGEFTATVKDENGCFSTATFELSSGISFGASVKTIIETKCAVADCHVAGTGRANFQQFSQIKSRASTILSHTKSGIMPPKNSGKVLTEEEPNAIACWVNDGANQN